MSSNLQRYVSEELTHFVGRHHTEQEQYALLVEILHSGWLTHPPHDPNVSGNLHVDRHARISDNEMYSPQIVCFADIPVGDMHIHLRKYSRFGVAFLKDFLIRQGANPVFYIAKESSVAVRPDLEARTERDDGAHRDLSQGPRTERVTRAEHFDRQVHEYLALQEALQDLMARGASKQLEALREPLRRLDRFLNYDILSFLKFFEAGKPDEDPENFYMEREWRIIGNVRFGLDDVRRVFIPESYAARFRRDVPDYAGQVTFVD